MRKKHRARAYAALLLFAAAHSASAQASTPPQPGQLPNASGPLELPNTVSAPPLTVGEKFDYRVVQTFGLRGLLGAFVGASIGQAAGSPYKWGGGVEGFAKRYASGFAGNLTRQTLAFGMESTLHEDPRYFPSGETGFKARTLNAMKQVFICKTDSGQSSFAYARVISSFAGAQLISTWQPASNASVGDGLLRGTYGLGGDLAYNILQEFLPFTRPVSLRHRH